RLMSPGKAGTALFGRGGLWYWGNVPGRARAVRQRPVRLAAPHHAGGDSRHGGVRRDVVQDDRVGADAGPIPDRDRADDLGAGADEHVVADGRRLAAFGADRHMVVAGNIGPASD